MPTFKFLSTLCVLALAVHTAWSLAVVGMLHGFYEHRIVNIRKTNNVGTRWEEFSSAFVSESLRGAASEKKPLVMFVGSSVTYGFPWQEDVIYTKSVANELPNWKVSNLSIIGVGMRALTDFATCSLGPSQRPDVLIVEIPLVNSTASIEPGINSPLRKCMDFSDSISSYWSLAFFRPYGIDWVSILWDEEAYKDQDSDLVIEPVPPSFFASKERFKSIEAQYISELRRFLNAVSNMGDRVFVYVSPIHTPAIAKAGGDQASVEYQIDLTYRICLEYKNLTCLDSSIFNQRPELFYNLTHLNHRGHRAVADWFKPYIHSQGRSDVSQRLPAVVN